MEFVSRYRNWLIGGTAAVLALFFAIQWQPARQVKAHQQEFLRAVERGSARGINDLLDASYQDQWGFDRSQIVPACTDFRRCFLTVAFEELDPQIELREGRGIYSVRIRVQGSPTAVGQFVRQQANALRTPWTFIWRGTPGMPWRWRLQRIENPGVPSLQGYTPGALRETLDMP
jgi:hypothetical protein